MVLPGWWQAPSGLILPSTLASTLPAQVPANDLPAELRPRPLGLAVATRQPERDGMEGMAAYFTEDEAEGLFRSSREEMVERARAVPVEPAIVGLSDLAARVWEAGNDGQAHLAIARTVFPSGGSLLADMGRFVAGERERVIFSEQGLFALISLLLLEGSDEQAQRLDTEQGFELLRALVGAPVLIEPERLEDLADKDWLSYLTQNLAFNARQNLANALGRSWRLFTELARDSEARLHDSFCPLDEWMHEDYGLTAEQQLAVGFGLHAMTLREGVGALLGAADVTELLSRLGLPDHDRALESLVARRGWYQQQLLETRDDPQRSAWDVLPLMQRPLLRLSNGNLVALSPRLMETWLTGGLYYRLLRSAQRRDSVQRFTAFFGRLVERYALALVRSAHPEPRLSSAGHVHEEQPFDGGGSLTTDIAVSYPRELVLLEVSSSRLTVPSRVQGDGQAIRRDLYKIAGKRVRQLDRIITALRAGQAELPGVEMAKIEVIRPVIVALASLRLLPQLSDHLKDTNSGALSQPGVQPLEILDLQDLEMLMAAIEHQRTLSDLLAQKARHSGNEPDLRQWLQADPTAPPWGRPRYVQAAFDAAFDGIAQVFDFEDSGELRDAA